MNTVVAEPNQLVKDLVETIYEHAERALVECGSFHLTLSGGSLIKALYDAGLGQRPAEYSQWTIFLADERFVPESSPDSTYGEYQRLFAITPLMAASFPNPIPAGVSLKECAVRYGQLIDRLDLIVLGLGPDGHTASLFPGREWNANGEKCIAVCNSPKPPPERISMTLDCILSAKAIVFYATGSSKRTALERITQNDYALPPSIINSQHHNVCWYLDFEAAPTK